MTLKAPRTLIVLLAMSFAGLPTTLSVHPAASDPIISGLADFIRGAVLITVATIGDSTSTPIITEKTRWACVICLTDGRQADAQFISQSNPSTVNLVDGFTKAAIFALSVGFTNLQNTFNGRPITVFCGTGDTPFRTGALITAILMIPDFAHLSIATWTFGAFLSLGASHPLFQAGAGVAAVFCSPAIPQCPLTAMGSYGR
jgi:hypothetical protein